MTKTQPNGARMVGRYLAIGIAGVVVAAVVAACSGGASGSGGSTSATPSSSPNAAGSSSSTRGAGGQRGPAASGKIAAVETGSIEVQSTTAGQLTVDYTAKTRISQTLQGTLADITVGSCIVAIDATAASGSTSTPSGTSPTTIAVSPAVNGSCTRTTAFGAGGARPSGANFTPGANRPSGFPSGRPSGLRSGAAGGANFANAITTGKVTALSGSTITVAAVSFARTSATASAPASPTTTSKTISVGSGTKITKDATVTSAALKVGLCASAQGKADTTGAVAATSIALTSPDSSGSCEAGSGRFGAGGGFGGGGFGGGSFGAGASESNG